MSKIKKAKRGYNQTELIAKKISQKLNIKYINNILVKSKNNLTQSSLTEKQRFENVKNVHTLSEYIDDERVVESSMGQPLQVYGSNFELLQELIIKLAEKLNEEAKNV